MLAERGYQIQIAADGEQALAIATARPESIDLLVTDMVMPGLNGRQTAAALRTTQPRMRVLYISGYTDDTVVRAGGYEPGIAFLQKPFSSRQLAEALQTLTASAGSNELPLPGAKAHARVKAHWSGEPMPHSLAPSSR
jgi:CheY-like chemotaxis protein